MPSRALTLVLPLVLLTVLSGCAPSPAASPASSPAASPAAPDRPVDAAAATSAPPSPVPVDDGGIDWEGIEAAWEAERAAEWARKPLMERIWRAEPPTGTDAEIALRFVRALQRRDDEAAAVELSAAMRDVFLASMPVAHLRRVLADVRRNAGVARGAACTQAWRLDADSVAVACGTLRVVVHMATGDDSRGVNLTAWRAHRDVYRGAHRHAFVSPAICPPRLLETLAC